MGRKYGVRGAAGAQQGALAATLGVPAWGRAMKSRRALQPPGRPQPAKSCAAWKQRLQREHSPPGFHSRGPQKLCQSSPLLCRIKGRACGGGWGAPAKCVLGCGRPCGRLPPRGWTGTSSNATAEPHMGRCRVISSKDISQGLGGGEGAHGCQDQTPSKEAQRCAALPPACLLGRRPMGAAYSQTPSLPAARSRIVPTTGRRQCAPNVDQPAAPHAAVVSPSQGGASAAAAAAAATRAGCPRPPTAAACGGAAAAVPGRRHIPSAAAHGVAIAPAAAATLLCLHRNPGCVLSLRLLLLLMGRMGRKRGPAPRRQLAANPGQERVL